VPGSTHVDRLLAAATGDSRLDRRDAEILLAAAAGLSRALLLVRDEPLPDAVVARFAEWTRRRAAGEPVAYLLGRREFWSREFEVDGAVLMPRPETELLVERVLELVGTRDASVADLGTGSGAIAIASDVSATALAVAQRNGQRLAPGRVDWRQSTSAQDWFSPLAGERFDAIASNPPYIAADDPALADDGVRFEPRGALTPGGDGFGALDILINEAPGHLAPGGWLVLEHGAAQGSAVRAALEARGFGSVTSHRDLAGHERISEARWPPQQTRP
jgi:release factor glutamine methyltransferase